MHTWILALAAATFPLFAQAGPPTAASPFDLDAAFAAACPPLVEARWTLIPWRHSLTDALAEAKQTRRPIYLYVNDGDVDSGRC